MNVTIGTYFITSTKEFKNLNLKLCKLFYEVKKLRVCKYYCKHILKIY
jgi:hypothetical protein